jgi:hypothetical protein
MKCRRAISRTHPIRPNREQIEVHVDRSAAMQVRQGANGICEGSTVQKPQVTIGLLVLWAPAIAKMHL